MAIIATDYKSKWFVLEDGDPADNERPDVDLKYVTGLGLAVHVERCRYFGIPAYTGEDTELKGRIEVIEKTLDEEERNNENK